MRFFAGPCARFSARSSIACSGVIDSGVTSRGRVRFVSPSVTYAPNRPSLTTIGLPLFGSSPSSRSGGVAARWPRPRLGCLYSSSASSRVTVNIDSSSGSDRESVPFLR
ncbi:Uncharacterised protein [Mycobacteroides abscessus]|nr:Uncharacterised protein [Mycobacteroides abscessus]